MLVPTLSCADLIIRPSREARVPVLGGTVRLGYIPISQTRVSEMSRFWSADTLFFCIDLDCVPVQVGMESGMAEMVSFENLK